MKKQCDLLLISVDSPVMLGIYEDKKLVKSYAQEGKFSDSLPQIFAKVLDSAKPQNLDKKNPCVSTTENLPASWCKKSESKGAVVPPADFLLEADKRGSPPKSEKRQLLARRGSGAGGAALLRKESNENSGNGITESTLDSADSTNLTINNIFYANGPGNFSAIKLTHIFLQTLKISLNALCRRESSTAQSKQIRLFCADAFHFSNNEFINAYGKVHFVKENGEIHTITLDSKRPNSFSLPQELDLRIFSEDCAPLYILPAV